jgi:GR25 family glycosyltransferase involved in LPS biosynthesis/tetratricopeptide (TPR) repeat protein
MNSQALITKNQLTDLALASTEANQFAPLVEDLLTLDGQSAKHFNLLSHKAWQLGLLREASRLLKCSLDLEPKQPVVLQSLGVLLLQLDQLESAKSCLEIAISLDANLLPARLCLGELYIRQRQFQKAVDCLMERLNRDPNSAETLTNLAIALRPLGRLHEAIKRAEQAITILPDNPNAHYILALLLLSDQRWKEGWQHHEWRLPFWSSQGMRLCIPVPNKKAWQGSDMAQTRLVLVSEQGLGDTFHFVRYGNSLKNRLVQLRICVPDNLAPLLKFSCPELSIVAKSAFVPTEQEDWLPLLSVLHVFGINPENYPISQPYLHAPEERALAWSTRIRRPGRFLVAVHWQGNPKSETGTLLGRSFPLQILAPLTTLPMLDFISLQKGTGSEQLEACSFLDRFVECQTEISNTLDFIETAAILKCCDLVITSDSGLAHLAGALSVPTWLLLHDSPDWRWGKEAESTHWYPSFRLFRLALDEAWSELIDRLAQALAKVLLGLSDQNNQFTLKRCLLPSLDLSPSESRRDPLPWRSAVISLDTSMERFQNFLSYNRACMPAFEILQAVDGSKYPLIRAIATGLFTASAINSKIVSSGTVGCAASHRLLWQSCLEQNKPLLILEDDIIIHPELKSFLLSRIDQLSQADIILFSVNTDCSIRYTSNQGLQQSTCFQPHHPKAPWIIEAFRRTDPSSCTFHQLSKACGTSCYLITPGGAKKLLEQVFPLNLRTVEYPFIANGLNQTAIDWRLSFLYDSLNALIVMPFLAYSPNMDSSTITHKSISPHGIKTFLEPHDVGIDNLDLESIHAFIFNWPGTIERCLQIETELLEFGLRVQVINSDPCHDSPGWLNLGEDAYFGKQFKAALASFDGEIFLSIQADTVFHDWQNFVSEALLSRKKTDWGVYSPNVLNTARTGRDILKALNPDGTYGITFAACVDETCWLIDRSVIQLFYGMGLAQLFADSHYGWGYNLVLCSLSYLSGRSVLRNNRYTVEHQQANGYSRKQGEIDFYAILQRLPISVQSCIEAIYNEPEKLLAYL